MKHRSRLAPEHMSEPALYQRARTLIRQARWDRAQTWQERERLLDELDVVVLELMMRGTQLRLV